LRFLRHIIACIYFLSTLYNPPIHPPAHLIQPADTSPCPPYTTRRYIPLSTLYNPPIHPPVHLIQSADTSPCQPYTTRRYIPCVSSHQE
jgi:hypothetical protein